LRHLRDPLVPRWAPAPPMVVIFRQQPRVDLDQLRVGWLPWLAHIQLPGARSLRRRNPLFSPRSPTLPGSDRCYPASAARSLSPPNQPMSPNPFT